MILICSEIYRDVIESHILPLARQQHDMWLESLGYWLLKRYEQSLQALVPQPTDGDDKEEEELQPATPEPAVPKVSGSLSLRPPSSATPSTSTPSITTTTRTSVALTPPATPSRSASNSAAAAAAAVAAAAAAVTHRLENRSSFNPAVVHFFNFLRKKAVVRHAKQPSNESILGLLRRTVYAYLHAGCPILALEQLIESRKLAVRAYYTHSLSLSLSLILTLEFNVLVNSIKSKLNERPRKKRKPNKRQQRQRWMMTMTEAITLEVALE